MIQTHVNEAVAREHRLELQRAAHHVGGLDHDVDVDVAVAGRHRRTADECVEPLAANVPGAAREGDQHLIHTHRQVGYRLWPEQEEHW